MSPRTQAASHRASQTKPLPHEFVCGRRTLHVGTRTHVMGILNVTPDSFSDGGVYFRQLDRAARHIEEMVRDGADIIDIGGESTRPGSKGVGLDEELDRVVPVIRNASRITNVLISIDTSKSAVAEEAIKNGASIVNDATALRGDPRMASVVAEYGAGLIVMHMKGTPRTMQANPVYKDIAAEIVSCLKESIRIAGEAGIERERIMVDPGIGFGKTAAHNLEILARLEELAALERPVMVGVSRKSFIGTILNRDVKGRLMGTAAACAVAITNGANVIRVHDVKEMADVAKIVDAIVRRGGS